jgi:S1-C subfamily serine protease
MRTALRYVVLVSQLFLYGQSVNAQSFQIDPATLGTINRRDMHTTLGTAFVAGSGRLVITCAHVLQERNAHYTYVPAHQPNIQHAAKQEFSLKPIAILPISDLAIFTSDEEITGKPLQFGDFGSLTPGANVLYVGFSVAERGNLRFDRTSVVAVGTEQTEGGEADFVEFEGVAMPGYSGGPVFDSHGRVVAILREAWWKTDPRTGTSKWLMNRGFSLTPAELELRRLKTRESVRHKQLHSKHRARV